MSRVGQDGTFSAPSCQKTCINVLDEGPVKTCLSEQLPKN